MYNRYIPEDVSYTRVEPPSSQESHRSSGPGTGGPRPAFHLPDFLSGKESLIGGREGSGLAGLLKTLHLDSIDAGDILLLLIMLYLMAEGDDLELVIALGLTLLMGLGGEEK